MRQARLFVRLLWRGCDQEPTTYLASGREYEGQCSKEWRFSLPEPHLVVEQVGEHNEKKDAR